MRGPDYIKQARQFEEYALRRWGDVYDDYDCEPMACIPTEYAADVVSYWRERVDDVALSKYAHQRAGNALARLERWASCPGSSLAPWAAERFWRAQFELASLLTAIRSPNVQRIKAPERPRNGWLATPGQILAEMKTTKAVIEDLSHAIFDRYRRPYLDAHEDAFAAFKRERGRYPDDDNPKDTHCILEHIAAVTGFDTTRAHLAAKTYEPEFVKAWDRFYVEWDNWYAGNKNWTARMWGGAWEKAIEYRKRANQWRERFEKLDPARNHVASPKPPVPDDPWDDLGDDVRKWLKWGAVAVAGLVVLPPVISALRRSE